MVPIPVLWVPYFTGNRISQMADYGLDFRLVARPASVTVSGMDPSLPLMPSAPTLVKIPPGELEALPLGPLTTAELAAAVPGAASREHYCRIWHGMYRREDQVDDLELRSRALARTFPDGVLRGRSAALLWGDDSVAVDALPEIWLPATRRAREGRIYRYGALPGHAVTEVDGLRVTTPLRTCRDLAVDLELEDAVVSAERLCAMVAELPAQLRAAAEHPSGRGARAFAQVVQAFDPRSASARSSRARMTLAAAGCGNFGHGHQVRLGGSTVVLPLADPVARCAVFTSPAAAWSGPGPGTGPGPGPGARPGARPGATVGGGPVQVQRDGTPARHQARLQGAGWTVIIVRGQMRDGASSSSSSSSSPSPSPSSSWSSRPGTVPDTGSAGIPRRAAALLATRWPETEIRLPAYGDPASDPHGIWGPSW